MKKKTLLLVGIIFNFIAIALVVILGTYAIIKNTEDKTIVETYESGLDEISIDYDVDNKQYDVYIFKTNKHYFVKENDFIVIPYTENEVNIEITKGGKCKLYFFIKWEAES